MTPTGRKPSQPNMQSVNPKTPEVQKIREALVRGAVSPQTSILSPAGRAAVKAALAGLNAKVKT